MENIPKEGWALITLVVTAIIRHFEKGYIKSNCRKNVSKAYEEGLRRGKQIEKEKK